MAPGELEKRAFCFLLLLFQAQKFSRFFNSKYFSILVSEIFAE